jgi:hypothetical protein
VLCTSLLSETPTLTHARPYVLLSPIVTSSNWGIVGMVDRFWKNELVCVSTCSREGEEFWGQTVNIAREVVRRCMGCSTDMFACRC